MPLRAFKRSMNTDDRRFGDSVLYISGEEQEKIRRNIRNGIENANFRMLYATDVNEARMKCSSGDTKPAAIICHDQIVARQLRPYMVPMLVVTGIRPYEGSAKKNTFVIRGPFTPQAITTALRGMTKATASTR